MRMPTLSSTQQAWLEERIRKGIQKGLTEPSKGLSPTGLFLGPTLRPNGHNHPIILSSPQQSLWVLEQMTYGKGAYVMQSKVRLKGTLDLIALEQSVNGLIERHEILRTYFRTENDMPVQIVAPPPGICPFLLSRVPVKKWRKKRLSKN